MAATDIIVLEHDLPGAYYLSLLQLYLSSWSINFAFQDAAQAFTTAICELQLDLFQRLRPK